MDRASFSINTPSDLAPDQHIWRDAYVKDALCRALQRRGHMHVAADPDVAVWLWSWIAKPILPGPRNILWVIGHPRILERHLDEMRMISWAKVFCSSRAYCKKLKREGIEAEWLVCPGADRPPFSHKPTHDLAFVGNADPKKGRDALIPIFARYSSNVVGNFPRASLREIAWHSIQDVFNSGRIVPYTHHADMREEGFVADAALDVMKNSGALLLSDSNPGWDDLSIPIPQWSTPDELHEMIRTFLGDEDARGRIATQCRVAAARYTMEYCAERMEEFF